MNDPVNAAELLRTRAHPHARTHTHTRYANSRHDMLGWVMDLVASHSIVRYKTGRGALGSKTGYPRLLLGAKTQEDLSVCYKFA